MKGLPQLIIEYNSNSGKYFRSMAIAGKGGAITTGYKELADTRPGKPAAETTESARAAEVDASGTGPCG